MADTILRVEGLRTHFTTRRGVIKAVDGLSFDLKAGKTLCIVGESGSGKTVSSLSIMRLVDLPGRIVDGRILYRDTDLLALDEVEMEKIRGDRIGMVFQDPMTSLNPVFPIGDQIAEGMLIHQKIGKAEARKRTLGLLSQVGIPHPEARYGDYPHQFSGGMRQRVLIASAIACRPDILITDEPTTALDVTIQAQILKLLKEVQRDLNSALVLVTHDLGVVAAMADYVMVMYAGRMVEYADVGTIFAQPRHPYTRGLLDSLIRLEDSREAELTPIVGMPPDLSRLPKGCSFAPRCPSATDVCLGQYPELRGNANGHRIACHLVSDLDAADEEADP